MLTMSLTVGLQNLPDNDVVRVLWTCLLKTINMTGKNQQQVMQAVMQKIKAYHKLLATFVTNARLELTLMVTVQVRNRRAVACCGASMLELNMQAFCCPPYGQPNDQ